MFTRRVRPNVVGAVLDGGVELDGVVWVGNDGAASGERDEGEGGGEGRWGGYGDL